MRRYCSLLFTLLLVLGRTNDCSCAEKDRILTVASPAILDSADADAAKEFARRITFRPGLSARAVDGTVWGAVWHRAPPGVEAPNHVNLLRIKHGKRYDYLAFLLGKSEGTFSCVARIPALEQEGPKYWFAASPGDNEILRNAPVDRVAEFAYQLRRAPGPRTVLQVEAKVWDRNKDGHADGELAGGAPTTNADDLKRLLPLVVAAVWEAGYAPTLVENAAGLSFAFSKRVDGFDVEATLTQEGKSVTRRHYGMRMENIYDELGLLCRHLGAWGTQVKAFGRLYPEAVVPLAATSREQVMDMEDILICQAKGYLLALGNRSVEPLWQIPAGGAEDRTKMRFAIPEGAGGSLIGFSRGSILRIDTSSGEHSILAQPGTDDRSSWAVDGGECAVRRENHLEFHRNGKEKWSTDCADFLTASPALNRDSVFVTTTAGMLHSFGRAEGKQRWQTDLGGICKSMLTTIKEDVFADDTTGILHCVAAADGKIRWRYSLGDQLLQPPSLVAGSLLVVTRKHRIVVLDPATGKEARSRQWPTWLRSVTPLLIGETHLLFSIDIRHRLSVLSWPKLKIRREMAFPFPLESPLLAISEFGTAWQGAADLEREETILLTDEKGNVFLLNPVELAGEGR